MAIHERAGREVKQGAASKSDKGESPGKQADAAGKMTVAQAGRKGGKATSRKHGRDFYEAIGRKGGVARGARYMQIRQESSEGQATSAPVSVPAAATSGDAEAKVA